jgi:hypothetical protein
MFTPAENASLSPPTFIADPPQWLIITITAAFVALLLGVIWFLWLRRPQSQEPPEKLLTGELLAKEARQAVLALQTGRDFKNTVMECYLKMNQVLSKQRGIHRQKAMTPREFENHLREIGLSNEHIRRLTRLFEKVRYGTDLPGRPEEQEAVACLRAIVELYG